MIRKTLIFLVPTVFIVLNLLREHNKPLPRDYLKEAVDEHRYQFQQEEQKAQRAR
jgi:hypothetical protein